MATILILGTLDTKGREIKFLKEAIEARGHETLVVNCGILTEPYFLPDVSVQEVAAAAGEDVSRLASSRSWTRAT